MKTDREILREVLDEHEICVACRGYTMVLKETHIDNRLNYIEGVGQLCVKCAKKYP